MESRRKELYEAAGRNRDYYVKAEDMKNLLPDWELSLIHILPSAKDQRRIPDRESPTAGTDRQQRGLGAACPGRDPGVRGKPPRRIDRHCFLFSGHRPPWKQSALAVWCLWNRRHEPLQVMR